MKTLEERVAALETSNVRRRYCAAVLAAVFLVGCFATKPLLHQFVWSRVRLMSELDRNPVFPAEVIKAKRLEIVNDDGVVVATLDAGDGGGTLNLHGSDSKALAWITADHRIGGSASFRDGNATSTVGNAKVSSTTISGGRISLGLDAQIEKSDIDTGIFRKKFAEAQRINLRIDDDGGLIELHGRTGNTAAQIGSFESGGGFVQVLNPAGKTVAEMQCSKANAGLITAKDFDGKMKEGLSGAK